MEIKESYPSNFCRFPKYASLLCKSQMCNIKPSQSVVLFVNMAQKCVFTCMSQGSSLQGKNFSLSPSHTSASNPFRNIMLKIWNKSLMLFYSKYHYSALQILLHLGRRYKDLNLVKLEQAAAITACFQAKCRSPIWSKIWRALYIKSLDRSEILLVSTQWSFICAILENSILFFLFCAMKKETLIKLKKKKTDTFTSLISTEAIYSLIASCFLLYIEKIMHYSKNYEDSYV